MNDTPDLETELSPEEADALAYLERLIDAAETACRSNPAHLKWAVLAGREVHEQVCVPGTDDIDEAKYDAWYDMRKARAEADGRQGHHGIAIGIATLRIYQEVKGAADVLNGMLS